MSEDLREQSKIINLISEFSSVAEALEKLLRGEDHLSLREKEILRTTGELFRYIDWNSKDYGSQNRSPKLTVLATELRPLFYEGMKKKGISLEDRGYFEGVYELLNSSGQKVSLSPERLERTIELFCSVAKSLRYKLPQGNI